MADIKTRYVLVGQDRTKGAFRSVNRSLGRFRSNIGTVQVALAGIASSALVTGISRATVSFERIQRSLNAVSGSAEEGARQLQFVREEANRLGLDFETAATSFARLAAATNQTNLEGETARQIFSAVAESATVLGLSAEQTQGALTALEQIVSKGTVSAEELRGQLGERLPGAFQIAARSIGVTTEELDKLLRNGELTADELLPNLARELRSTFGAEVETAANSTQAAFNRLSTAVFELQTAIAQSGVIDLITNITTSLTGLTSSVTAFFNTTLEERRDQLKAEIAEAEKIVALNDGKNRRSRQKRADEAKLRLQGLNFELEITEERLNREEKITEARVAQRKEAERILGINEIDISQTLQRLELIAGKTMVNEIDISGQLKRIAEQREINSEATRKQIELVREEERAVEQLGLTFSSAFEDAIVGGESLRSVMQGLYKDIVRIFLRTQIILPSATSLSTGLGSLFAGFRASGGPVSAGKGYVVGEQGPEYFMPATSGTIIPNGQFGGASVSIVNNIDASGADTERIYATLPPILEASEARTIAKIQSLKQQGLF